MNPTHTYCSHCGTRFEDGSPFPRQCASCQAEVFLNPIPVVVCVVPIKADRVVIGPPVIQAVVAQRRNIEPARGKLAMPAGYMEMGESWQAAACRELAEEVRMIYRPEQVSLFDVLTVATRVLIFAKFPWISEAAFHAMAMGFEPNDEVQEILPLTDPAWLEWGTHQNVAERVINV